MRIINADKFLAYLIFSKHIDGLTCDEVKEAIEMSKVDVFDKIKTEIEQFANEHCCSDYVNIYNVVFPIIDKYSAETER